MGQPCYGNAGQWRKAEAVYNSIAEFERNIFVHSAMIKAYGNQGCPMII